MEGKKKKIVFIDGGLGRVICSIPAVEKLAEKEKVIVITSHVEPYMYNPNIERVYPINTPYIFEDVLYDNDFIHPEPYTFSGYYHDRMHLINAFDLLINNSVTISNSPKIYLNQEEEKFGKDFIENMKKQFKKKKAIIFQPFGQGFDAMCNDCNGNTCNDYSQVKDTSNRSLSVNSALKIAQKLSEKAVVIYYGQAMIDSKFWAIPKPQMPERAWFTVIKHCDAIISVDSSLQHIAHAFNKPGVVLMGGTFKENVSYEKSFKIFQRPGYPKAYDPIRLPTFNLVTNAGIRNTGAMDFTDRELDQVINAVKKLIT